MKQAQLFKTRYLMLLAIMLVTMLACSDVHTDTTKQASSDSLATNITMYRNVWDEILNKRKLENFNNDHFTTNAEIYASPSLIVGIDSIKAYYNNFLTGFSNISFTVKDIFGMDNKIVKHWNFKGTHTGPFFGIPATNKKVDVDGVTLVRMENGKIAAERDFMDNLDFMQQLGVIPR